METPFCLRSDWVYEYVILRHSFLETQVIEEQTDSSIGLLSWFCYIGFVSCLTTANSQRVTTKSFSSSMICLSSWETLTTRADLGPLSTSLKNLDRTSSLAWASPSTCESSILANVNLLGAYMHFSILRVSTPSRHSVLLGLLLGKITVMHQMRCLEICYRREPYRKPTPRWRQFEWILP